MNEEKRLPKKEVVFILETAEQEKDFDTGRDTC